MTETQRSSIAAKGGLLLAAASGGWFLEQPDLGDGAERKLWAAPPSVLSRLLVDLFSEAPDDVLSWLHLAVWRLRTEELSSNSPEQQPTPEARKSRLSNGGGPPETKFLPSVDELSSPMGTPKASSALAKRRSRRVSTKDRTKMVSFVDSIPKQRVHVSSSSADSEERSAPPSTGSNQISNQVAAALQPLELANEELKPERSSERLTSKGTEETVFYPSDEGLQNDLKDALNGTIPESAGVKHARIISFDAFDDRGTASRSFESSENSLKKEKGMKMKASYSGKQTTRHHVKREFQRGGSELSRLDAIDEATGEVKSEFSGTGYCVVSPLSGKFLMWQVLFCLVLLFDVWATPFQIVFLMGRCPIPEWFESASTVILVFFSCDLVLNFFTGFLKDGILVTKHSMIAREYMKRWFLIDLVPLLPDFIVMLLEFLQSSGTEDTTTAPGGASSMVRVTRGVKVAQSMKALRMVRTFRLIQTQRITNFMMMHFDLGAKGQWLSDLVRLNLLIFAITHFHACMYGWLEPTYVQEIASADMALSAYVRSFWRAYMALTSYAEWDADGGKQAGLQVFGMFVAFERLLLLMMVYGWLFMRVMILHGEEAELLARLSGACAYLKRHKVSAPMQLQVYQNISETCQLRQRQMHFAKLCNDMLPITLRKELCKELWSLRLMSLGLILTPAHWHDDFMTELSLLVHEEVLTEKVPLFVAGDSSAAAYLVLTGTLTITRLVAVEDRSGADYKPGMWIGEQALVNQDIRREETIVCKTKCQLMVVPAQDFHDLLDRLRLRAQYTQLLQKKLWLGLCGRCGVLGDHFSAECPWIERFQERGRASTLLHWGTSKRSSGGFRTRLQSTRRDSGRTSMVVENEVMQFLQKHGLGRLAPWMREHAITGVEELYRSLEQLRSDPTVNLSHEEAQILSDKELIRVFRRRKNFQLWAASPSKDNRHLVFVSHYKLEAGSEAALMRIGLERLLLQDSIVLGRDMKAPVFLDSEDLQDLTELQAEVERSHNLVLLLTSNVLTRPWVLVEIVTAVRAGVRVLPVEVHRPGTSFQFPDEAYYQRLADGKELDEQAVKLLKDKDISLEDMVGALRQAFVRIAVPFSPHKSANIREAELLDLLKHCQLRDMPEDCDDLIFDDLSEDYDDEEEAEEEEKEEEKEEEIEDIKAEDECEEQVVQCPRQKYYIGLRSDAQAARHDDRGACACDKSARPSKRTRHAVYFNSESEQYRAFFGAEGDEPSIMKI